MALFGLPGGAEWLVIGATVLMLFFPGALLVWLGFVLGRRSAGAGAETGPPAPARAASPAAPATPDEIAETEDGH
jgi:hypothetical protein